MTELDVAFVRSHFPQFADGWAFFEYRLTDHGLGWSMDDCACWGADGTPLALARQRRKLL